MVSRTALLLAFLVAPVCWAQHADRMKSQTGPVTTIGPRNVPLYDGAQALLANDAEEGVRLTHIGLQQATGRREEEAALSNLCAGYIRLEKYDEAIKYCNELLERNDKSWRGYNNRAVIYIQTEQYELADKDLKKGEELNPGARTLKLARAMYRDAVDPVAPQIEIDDRQGDKDEEPRT